MSITSRYLAHPGTPRSCFWLDHMTKSVVKPLFNLNSACRSLHFAEGFSRLGASGTFTQHKASN
eukprot:2021141-Amphidinium_carterae.1